MKKCTKQLFDEIAEDFYYLVADDGMSLEQAAKTEADSMRKEGIYDFNNQAARHNCKSLKDIYIYGGQLAGDIDSF